MRRYFIDLLTPSELDTLTAISERVLSRLAEESDPEESDPEESASGDATLPP